MTSLTTQAAAVTDTRKSQMAEILKYTELFSEATILPDHYRGRKGDIFVAVQTAYRMNMDPMMVMQGTYVIHGKLGMTSAFAISLANSSGVLQGGISYDVAGEGQKLRVTAKAHLKACGSEISYTIGMKEATAEGWTNKKGSKYNTMPELMLRYRAAIFLIRTHIPQVLNGMHMIEEIEDVRASKCVKTVKSANEPEVRNITASSKLDSFLDSEAEDAREESEQKVEPVSDTTESQGETAEIKVIEQADQSQLEELQQLVVQHSIPAATVERWCKKAGVATISELPEEILSACIDYVKERSQGGN